MRQEASSLAAPGEVKVKTDLFEFEGSGWILILIIGLVAFWIYAKYWHSSVWRGTKSGLGKLKNKLKRRK